MVYMLPPADNIIHVRARLRPLNGDYIAGQSDTRAKRYSGLDGHLEHWGPFFQLFMDWVGLDGDPLRT